MFKEESTSRSRMVGGERGSLLNNNVDPWVVSGTSCAVWYLPWDSNRYMETFPAAAERI